MEIRFKKLHKNATAPTRAHETDAGFDLTAVSAFQTANEIVYSTGLAVEIPAGYVGLLFPRSSIYKYRLALSNCVGVIDAGYRGEICAHFRIVERKEDPLNFIDDFYKPRDRFLQLIIMKLPEVSFIEAETLSDTDRGCGGFGSTGK